MNPQIPLVKYHHSTFCDTLVTFGVTVDDVLKFDKHVANVCRKVSQQVVV